LNASRIKSAAAAEAVFPQRFAEQFRNAGIISERPQRIIRLGKRFSNETEMRRLSRSFSLAGRSLSAMASRSTSSPFPGFSRIYRLLEPGASRAFRASLDMTGEEASLLLGGDADSTAVIQGRWAMGGSNPQDIVWTTLALPMVVSERVVGILRESGFSGWDVLPVELRDKDGLLLPTYYYLRVRGRCGPIESGRSEKIDKIYPGGVFPIWRGLYFDAETWDGSDLFMAIGAGFKFVVESVKHVFEEAKVKNVLFTPLNEVELESMDA